MIIDPVTGKPLSSGTKSYGVISPKENESEWGARLILFILLVIMFGFGFITGYHYN